MTHIGIDIEQFVQDPYGSGIQRVLQQLALQWPSELSAADFVAPIGDHGNQFLLLNPSQAGELFSLSFRSRDPGQVRQEVTALLEDYANSAPVVDLGRLLALYSHWLLPEVSYLPSVLERFELFQRVMPASMIGYDALPMTEPGNYRFPPGSLASVSEYFRLLAAADSVICISDYSRDSILDRLRRDRALPTSVAHPGGDHITVRANAARPANTHESIRMLRVGTLEARKFPLEILAAFEQARKSGAQLELVFIGAPSASDERINSCITNAVNADIGVSWITGADDSQVVDEIHLADVFLSIGTEGFGIPVLEAIALGTPVAYAGIQPAGDIMEGRGSRRLGGLEREQLSRSFMQLADPGYVEEIRQEIDVDVIPTWRDFARDVCQGTLNA